MENYSVLFWGLIVGALVVFAIIYYWKNRQLLGETETLPYAPQSHFLTPAELNFYRVLLQSAVDLDCHIMCKVRVADLIKVEKSLLKKGDSWQKYFNKIQAKHIDFIVCDSQMQPKLFFELDDSSHQKKHRKERDEFLNQAFQDSGLRLIRVKVKKSYSTEKFRAGIAKYL